MTPILNLANDNNDVVYAFDLINEIEAPINQGYFSNYWIDARAWITNIATFINSKSPWLAVTASAGWDNAVQEVTMGLFSGLNLNFYDVHNYSDSGLDNSSNQITALCSKALSDNRLIVLGEFGQVTQLLLTTTSNRR